MKTTKLISIFLAVFALLPIFSSCGNREHRSETTASSEPISEGVSSGMTENNDDKSPKWAEYGLQTADDGTVMLGGEAYTGMGVNFFDPMNVMSIIGEEKLEEYFKGLSEGNIPYIRMKCGFFYSYELSSYYSPAKKIIFFKNLDKIVRMAEKHNVGIIASLIWNSNIFPEYFNETLDMNVDPESKSVKEAIKYVIEIVNRYKESPAIWAWEIGNELDLACDTWKYVNKDGEEVLFTYELLNAYYAHIGTAVRECDPYRMIVGGTYVRSSSFALAQSGGQSWAINNEHGWKKTFERYTPEPLDAISLHYPSADVLGTVMSCAKELNIGLFIGEYHSSKLYNNPYDEKSPEEDPLEKAEQEALFEGMKAIDESGVQLSCIWQFGRCVEVEDNSSIELGIHNGGKKQNYHAFEKLGEYNRGYIKSGKSKANEYWANAELCFQKD